MLSDTCLFDPEAAMENGVGATLHAKCPGVAERTYLIRGTQLAQCAEQVCARDVSAIYRLFAWKLLTPDPNKRTYSENFKDAERLPWWLILAGTNGEKVRHKMREGVKEIWMQCNEGDKQVIMINNAVIVGVMPSKVGVSLACKKLR